jgi:hypothetical protein
MALACTPGATVEIAPGASAELAAADRLEIVEATRSTAALGEEAMETELAGALSRRLSPLTVQIGVEREPELREADPTGAEVGQVVLVYRRSDFLDDYPRPQPNDRWYWWAVLFDAEGETLASLHGEMEKEGGRSPEERFAGELRKLLRRARKTGG